MMHRAQGTGFKSGELTERGACLVEHPILIIWHYIAGNFGHQSSVGLLIIASAMPVFVFDIERQASSLIIASNYVTPLPTSSWIQVVGCLERLTLQIYWLRLFRTSTTTYNYTYNINTPYTIFSRKYFLSAKLLLYL